MYSTSYLGNSRATLRGFQTSTPASGCAKQGHMFACAVGYCHLAGSTVDQSCKLAVDESQRWIQEDRCYGVMRRHHTFSGAMRSYKIRVTALNRLLNRVRSSKHLLEAVICTLQVDSVAAMASLTCANLTASRSSLAGQRLRSSRGTVRNCFTTQAPTIRTLSALNTRFASHQ